MLRRFKLILMGAALLLGVSVAETAQAQVAGMWPWTNGYGLPYNVYGYSSERIPYFALHPPVYYSYPVPRTYGYSPFAYPPTVMTPDGQSAGPRVIANPFVPSSKESQTDSNRTAAAPQIIRNPYVDISGDDASELAAQPLP